MKILGYLMMIGGVVLGLYVGGWICFVGGIIDVITQVRAQNMVVETLAIGIAKIIFAGFLGSLCAIVLMIPGMELAFGTRKKRS